MAEMSSANLEVVFEGPAVKAGAIDARLLAESLLGYSEVFTRANEIVNGEVSRAVVLVQSEFKRGSFVAGLEFVQTFTEQAANLITSHQFWTAAPIVGLIGFVPVEFAKEVLKDLAKESVVALFKRFKGKKPDEVKRVDDNTVELKKGNEVTSVNVNVFNMYGDSAIRAGLEKVTRPLREAEIDRITVKQDDKEEVVFEKPEAEYFEAEPLRLSTGAETMEGEREAVLVVAKLSFREGTNWTFFERGATVVAKIQDDQFWDRVHKHEVTFGEGDVLKVRLAWEIREQQRQLKQKNTIVKVIEKLDRPKQMRLDGRKDDEPKVRKTEGGKFR
jgi:hypothetical protein